MTNYNCVSTPAVASTQPVNHLLPTPARTLKLALDVHLAWHVAAMQFDGDFPKPPQRFAPAALLAWVQKQIASGWRVVSCYEAGPFGYTLHRQLVAVGVTNYVIRPRNWDEQHKRVKTDRTDALAMLSALDRFLAGNPHALAIVRVPTEAEERARTQARLRQSLYGDLKRLAQRGRGIAMQYGYRLKGPWYGTRQWPRLVLPDWLRALLSPLQASIAALAEQVRVQTRHLVAASTGTRPRGLGALTQQLIDREVGDWSRFNNRRQVSSYLGLCPSEKSSGPRQQLGHITKCGNPRLRWALTEAAWRLLNEQPEYRLCRKWRARIADARTPGGRKKQLVTALARGFGVDLWRLRTGRTTMERLGLRPYQPQNPPATAEANDPKR